MATPSTSSSLPPPQKPVPKDFLFEGVMQDSTAIVQQGLDIFSNSSKKINFFSPHRAFSLAVKRAKPDIVRYVLDTTDVKVTSSVLPSIDLAQQLADEEGGGLGRVVEVLLEKGWDVNDGGQGGPDSGPLVYRFYWSEELLHWCLNHGARVDYSYTGPEKIQPLLDVAGREGTVSTFKLLMEKGANLGPRTLHRAVQGASSGKPERMELVRFLVEEMGCEVNGMDKPADKRYSAYYGTPLNYAAYTGGAVEVVKYLLEKGANPEIKDCWDMDAFRYAGIGGNSVLEVLTQWKEQREKAKA